MPRKNDAHKDDLEGVAQRLRSERAKADPLMLDRIKTTVMSRANAASSRGRVGVRRLAVVSLTVGLMAAGTGGVLAGEDHGNNGGNAANAQYGGECNINNGNGNSGSHNGNGNENYNCNENSFNNTTINEITTITTTSTTSGAPIINNYYTTVSATPAGSGGVDASKTTKLSGRHIKIHVKVPHGLKLRKVTVRVDGKPLKTLSGKKASANVELVNLPCSTSATTVEITVTLSNGKTVTSSHQYHLCVA